MGGEYTEDKLIEQPCMDIFQDLKWETANVYEGETFELQEAFDFPFESYERCGNGKGEYKNRGKKKILNIKYTPDFIGEGFIIETKGRANESFPLRWKMFKKFLTERIFSLFFHI